MNKIILIGGGIILFVGLRIGIVKLSEKLEIPVKMQEVVDFTETVYRDDDIHVKESTLEEEIDLAKDFFARHSDEPVEFFVSKFNLKIFVDEVNKIYTIKDLKTEDKSQYENLNQVFEYLENLEN